jgi:hypothetical protein
LEASNCGMGDAMVILLGADQQSAVSPYHSFKRGFRRSNMRNAKSR